MRTPKTWLTVEALETREVPAVAVQLDYSYDSSGFFNDPTRRALLQQAVNTLASQLDANLPAIATPAGSTWSATFFNPATGQQASVANRSIAANTLLLYVGGRNITGSEAAFGGSGGFSASGTQAFYNTLYSRGPSGTLLWGGSISFDTSTDWFFGNSLSGITSNQVDFLSVAEHEFGHVLGIGTSPKWFSQSSGGYFRGANSMSLYGGPVPLSADGAHWADGVSVNGTGASLDPYITRGTRVTVSSLDFAGLKDLGWSISGPALPAFSSKPLGVAPVAVGSSLLNMITLANGGTSSRLIALSGRMDGSVQIFTEDANGNLTAAGPQFQPFPGFTGIVRSTIADFDGDRKADFAFATGKGATGTIRIISGATGKDLVPPTTVLGGFSGGVFLAAGDVDRDGKSELTVSADVGGGPRVSLFKVQNNSLRPTLDFIAFDLTSFRGGSRIAMADINKDGAADLIVGAGVGGGPRVSVYDGTSLLSGNLNHLVPDFFALDSTLRSGVYLTADDVNGDGYADVIYSTGVTGGPRVRIVSGYMLVTNPSSDVSAMPALADFFALDERDRNGLRIATRDLDGDGKAELIVGSGARDEPSLRVISLSEMYNGSPAKLQNPFGDPTTVDGIYIG